MSLTANGREHIVISSLLTYDGHPSHRKFRRESIKIGWDLRRSEETRWMGDIIEGVSHFLCPEVKAWLPKQRYDVTIDEKRSKRMKVAEQWIQGLSDGTYFSRVDIARAHKISRARVTQLLNCFSVIR